MADYSLTIQIDPTGLRVLAAADQVIAIVKSATNPRYAVVWQVIHPTAQNVITWNGAYQVYASATAIAPGVSLSMAATTVATGGHTYRFKGGQFEAGTTSLPASHIGLRNQDRQFKTKSIPMLTGGVQEAAEVNGHPITGPLDAQSVLYGGRAYSVLSENLLVFAAGGVVAGTLLERSWLLPRADAHAYSPAAGDPGGAGIVLGTPLALDLNTITDQTIHYVDAENTFGPGPAS